jgi:hypothetical protein
MYGFAAIALLLSIYFFCFFRPFPNGSVVVYPISGTGNQMFQYAAAYSLAKSTDSKLYVVVDQESEKKGNITNLDRNFALGHFNIPKEYIIYKHKIKKFFRMQGDAFLSGSLSNPYLNSIKKRIKLFFNVTFVDDVNIFDFANKKNNQVLFLNDYFESEIYFESVKDDILKIFTPKAANNKSLESLITKVSDNDSFCVHVRRGDMLDMPHFLLPIDYQNQAIKLVKKLTKNPNFYIFSDSPEIAKRELIGLDNASFVDVSSQESLLLMSKCANNIIANSSFSWWAAYLNRNKDRLVIAPYPRYSDLFFKTVYSDDKVRYSKRSLYKHNAYPKNWIALQYNKFDLEAFAKKHVDDRKKLNEILKYYRAQEFNIYTGDLKQLNICEGKGSFYSNLCLLNNNSKLPTVVTAYYEVKNKYGHDRYLEWIKNFVTIPFNLVVYTDKAHADFIRKLRGDLPLVLIEREFNDLYHNKFYKKYQHMYKLDSNKNHSPELYIIWADKVKFVNDAINLNPYESEFFFWVDIGIFREKDYISKSFPSNAFVLANQMNFFSIEDFSNPDMFISLVNNDSIRLAGSPQAGNIASWKLYDVLWDKTLEDLMDRNITNRNDQMVMAAIKLKYPDFINLNYSDIRFRRNRWWYSLIFLQ